MHVENWRRGYVREARLAGSQRRLRPKNPCGKRSLPSHFDKAMMAKTSIIGNVIVRVEEPGGRLRPYEDMRDAGYAGGQETEQLVARVDVEHGRWAHTVEHCQEWQAASYPSLWPSTNRRATLASLHTHGDIISP